MFDNREQLIGVSVQGNIVSPEYPALPASPYVIGADGRPQLLPSQGGIVYNVHVGDSAFGWTPRVDLDEMIGELSSSTRRP